MTTTMIRNSKVGDAWITECHRINPPTRIMDPNTGKPTGNFLTGPCRLAFPNVFQPGKPMKNDPNATGKYGAVLLFTPLWQQQIFVEEYYAVIAREFSEYYDKQSQQYNGLDTPFRDQRDKTKFAGYTPGCIFTTTSSNYKPTVVDARMNPIVDEKRVYPGVWCICSVNCYPYGKNPPYPRKGARFGLQAVMVLADDEPLGGGPADAKTEFSGVNLPPPAAVPAAAFGGLPGGQPGPAPLLPGQTPPIGTQAPRAAPPAAPFAPPVADDSWMR